MVYIILKYLTVSGCAGLLGCAVLGCVAALAVLPSPPPAQLFVLCGGQGGAENNVILYTGLCAE